MESTSAWRTCTGACGCPTTTICFCRFMDSRSTPAWEQQHCMSVKVCGVEDGGGAPGPPTVKGECDLIPKKKISEVFSLPPHAWPGDAPKGASLGLGGGLNANFCVIFYCQSVKICECSFKMHDFHCIGGGSVRPPLSCQTLGRVMCRKARRLALVQASMLFSTVYHVCNM